MVIINKKIEKLDPYNNKKLYERWKSSPYNSNVSKETNKIISQYIFDMELGKNISRHSSKGSRSYTRLNHLRQKVFFIAELLEKNYNINDITKVNQDNMHKLFSDMRKGKIRKLDGGIYEAVGDYTKNFKAYWHWYQLINNKKGILIEDITVDLDTSQERIPEFVYFTEEQFNELIKIADEDLKVVMLFMYDTGMRVTEMLNIKVSDFINNFKEVNIRNETSKTFGRRIKLMMCPDVIQNYVKIMCLKPENFLIRLTADQLNKALKPIGIKVLNKDNLTLYDFRHSSACYFYPRYPNVQGLLYRFGWKKLEMAHYYSRFLGMEDTITEENLLLGVTKTELEKEMQKIRIDNQKMREENQQVRKEMSEFMKKLIESNQNNIKIQHVEILPMKVRK